MIAMVLGNTRGQNDRAAVEKSADDLVSFFRQARQYSLAVRQLGSQYPSYGVYMAKDGTTAIMYADCVPDDNVSHTITEADTFRYLSSGASNCTGSGGGSTITETLNLQTRTKISKITTTSVGAASPTERADLSVLFIRPEPTIWLSYSGGYIRPGSMSIELTNNAGTEAVTVTINSAGFVRVN